MTCQFCGKEISEGVAFCPFCAAKLQVNQTQDMEQSSATYQQNYNNQQMNANQQMYVNQQMYANQQMNANQQMYANQQAYANQQMYVNQQGGQQKKSKKKIVSIVLAIVLVIAITVIAILGATTFGWYGESKRQKEKEKAEQEIFEKQFLKYIRKSNAASDTILCDTVRTAILTALMDPDVISSADYNDISILDEPIELNELCQYAGVTFSKVVYESLGVSDYDELLSQVKSINDNTPVKIMISFVDSITAVVYIPHTNLNGDTKLYDMPNPDEPGKSCIYWGPAELMGK